MAKRHTFHHGNLRQALIEAALELLDTRNVAGTTLRAVAAHAGVSHAAPANHFRDRRALLTAVAAAEFSRLWTHLERNLVDAALTGPDRITLFSKTIVSYAIQYPNRYDLLWRNELVDHQDKELLSVMDRIYDALCSEIRLVAQNDAFDIHTFAVSIWSITHGYIALRLSGMFEELEDEVRHEPRFDAMMALLTDAIRLPVLTKT